MGGFLCRFLIALASALICSSIMSLTRRASASCCSRTARCSGVSSFGGAMALARGSESVEGRGMAQWKGGREGEGGRRGRGELDADDYV